MSAAGGLVEVRVPDMGNFKDVAVIDVLVKPGDRIEPDAPQCALLSRLGLAVHSDMSALPDASVRYVYSLNVLASTFSE